MKYSILLLTALCAITATLATQNCPLNQPKDLIQTGIITYAPGDATCYDVKITAFHVPSTGFHGVVSASDLSSLSFSHAIDYLITGRVNSNASDVYSISFMTDSTYTKVQLSYLVHARTDMWTGQFIADTTETFDCLYSGSTKIISNYTLPSWMPPSTGSSVTPFAFISGLKSDVNAFNFNMTVQFNRTTGKICVTFNFVMGVNIEHIRVSYLIASSSIGATVTEESGIVITGSYSWVGTASITLQNPVTETVVITFDRLTCIGKLCIKPCVTTPECHALSAIPNHVNHTCVLCEANQVLDHTGACVCDNKSFENANKVCEVCETFSSPNPAKTGCNCIDRYYAATEHTCMPVPNCKQGGSFDLVKKKCVCTYSNAIYNAVSGCACGANEVINVTSSKCECDKKSYMLHNACVKCWNSSTPTTDSTHCRCINGYYTPSGAPYTCKMIPSCPTLALFNQTNEQCQCIYAGMSAGPTTCLCEKSHFLNMSSKSCACSPGNYQKGGKCIPCWANSIPHHNMLTCDCKAGFYTPINATQKCVLIPMCGANAKLNTTTKQCECLSKSLVQQPDKISCKCPSPAQTLQPITFMCVCKDNTYTAVGSNQACQACWLNSINNAKKDWCVCVSGQYAPKANNKSCVAKPICPTGSMFSLATETCACTLPDQVVVMGKCQCPDHTTLASTGHCVCSGNVYKDMYGKCMNCWNNSKPNYKGDGCDCNENYYAAPGTAKTCHQIVACGLGANFDKKIGSCVCVLQTQAYINGKCQCSLGQQLIAGSNACACNATSYAANHTAICTKCWNNSSPSVDRKTCDCHPHFIAGNDLKNRSCVPAMSCAVGAEYNLEQNRCVCPDPNMMYSMKGCKCGENMVGNPQNTSQCMCNAESYKPTPTSHCVICWIHSKPNLLKNGCDCDKDYTLSAPKKCTKIPVVIPPTSLPCSPQPTDAIQTGVHIYSISNPKAGKRDNCGQIAINRTIITNMSLLQYAVAIIDLQNLKTIHGIDFSVNGKVQGDKLEILLTVDGMWTNMKVSYIITARTDIFMGTFYIDTSATMECANTGAGALSYSQTHTLANWARISQSSVNKTVIFISGVRTNVSSLSFTENATFDSMKGALMVNFDFSAATSGVEYLKISYIVIMNAPFDSSVVVGFATQGDYITPIGTGLHNDAISVSSLIINFQRYNCHSKACPSMCVSKSTCSSIMGKVSPITRECTICDKYEEWNGQKCVCNTHAYSKNGGPCMQCILNSVANANRTACDCIAGHRLQKDQGCVAY